jgi:hypothetical protein
MMSRAYHPSCGKKYKIGGFRSRPTWAKARTYLQHEAEQKGHRCGSKCWSARLLSSNPSTIKKKKKDKQKPTNFFLFLKYKVGEFIEIEKCKVGE